MSGSFTWAELEEYISRNRERNIQHLKEILPESEYNAEETFDNIKFDILLEKDQDAILESVKKSFENTQEKIIKKFGNTSKEYHQWVYHPDLIWVDALVPSSEELEKMMKGQVCGLSMDAVYFDESSVLNNPEEDKSKKKKNIRDDVRSFLNKGRKW